MINRIYLVAPQEKAGMLLMSEVLAIVVTGYNEVGLKRSSPLELHAI
jgi:hypothetical protein